MTQGSDSVPEEGRPAVGPEGHPGPDTGPAAAPEEGAAPAGPADPGSAKPGPGPAERDRGAADPATVAPDEVDAAGVGPAGVGPAADQDGLLVDLDASQARVAALTDDLKRLQAEYVNYKRRVERDRELVQQNSTYKVLSALLPVLDDIDRAREHGEVEGGFKAVADALDRVVSGLGLTKFGSPGDAFDPNLHEALMHAHSAEVTTTTCRDIVTAGYLIGDRVVRPARVVVVDPEPAER